MSTARLSAVEASLVNYKQAAAAATIAAKIYPAMLTAAAVQERASYAA